MGEADEGLPGIEGSVLCRARLLFPQLYGTCYQKLCSGGKKARAALDGGCDSVAGSSKGNLCPCLWHPRSRCDRALRAAALRPPGVRRTCHRPSSPWERGSGHAEGLREQMWTKQVSEK